MAIRAGKPCLPLGAQRSSCGWFVRGFGWTGFALRYLLQKCCEVDCCCIVYTCSHWWQVSLRHFTAHQERKLSSQVHLPFLLGGRSAGLGTAIRCQPGAWAKRWRPSWLPRETPAYQPSSRWKWGWVLVLEQLWLIGQSSYQDTGWFFNI